MSIAEICPTPYMYIYICIYIYIHTHTHSKHISWRQLKLKSSTISGRNRVYSLAFSYKQMQRSSLQTRTISETRYAQTRRHQLQ